MKFIKNILSLFFVFSLLNIFAQVPNGYNEFKYQNGNTSAEGYMKDGKPNGYWKSYYENGYLKSEGNREDFKLDSLWKFYSEDGTLNFTVNYANGLKNGYRRYFNKDSVIIKQEYFVNDTLQDSLKLFYQTGQIRELYFYKDGKRVNYGYKFDTLHQVTILINYENNPPTSLKINRTDKLGRKTGVWIGFYENLAKAWEVNYFEGKKNGIERKYTKSGALLSINKFSNGSLITDVKNLKKINLQRTLSPEGFIGKTGGYTEDGIPHGIHRKYDKDGNVIASEIYDNGIITGKGIVLKNGKKNGFWELYYDNGNLKAKGEFINGVKKGKWLYYYPNDSIESEVFYDRYGKKQGVQVDYFESGDTLLTVEWLDGYENGLFIQYNDSGKLVAKGNYIDGYEDGDWYYAWGDHVAYGKYSAGNKTDEWRHYYNNKQIVFKGKYENGLPVGKHLFWFENGNIKKFGKYKNGRKEGEWYYYSKGGKLIMVIDYENGLQRRYNGYKITPAHTSDDYVEYDQTGYE